MNLTTINPFLENNVIFFTNCLFLFFLIAFITLPFFFHLLNLNTWGAVIYFCFSGIKPFISINFTISTGSVDQDDLNVVQE